MDVINDRCETALTLKTFGFIRINTEMYTRTLFTLISVLLYELVKVAILNIHSTAIYHRRIQVQLFKLMIELHYLCNAIYYHPIK